MGNLSGKFNEESRFGRDDHRSRMPEFQGSRFAGRLRCVRRLTKFSESRGRPLSQVALRWVLDIDDNTLCLFGAKSATQVAENVGADEWRLGPNDLAMIDALLAEWRS